LAVNPVGLVTACSPAPIVIHADGRGADPLEYNAYDKFPGRSFINTVCHPDNVEGRTHADNVIELVKSKLAASATDTESFTPSNNNADPYRPDGDHDAPDTDPLFPNPDTSPADDPAPSLNPNPNTKPTGAAVTLMVFDVEPVAWAESVTVRVMV